MWNVFVIANEDEISNPNWIKVSSLMERYEPIFALQELEEIHSLSRLSFLYGTHFLKYIDKTIDDGSRIYQLKNDFVNKAGSLSFEEQCRLSAIWCADICWLKKC